MKQRLLELSNTQQRLTVELGFLRLVVVENPSVHVFHEISEPRIRVVGAELIGKSLEAPQVDDGLCADRFAEPRIARSDRNVS